MTTCSVDEPTNFKPEGSIRVTKLMSSARVSICKGIRLIMVFVRDTLTLITTSSGAGRYKAITVLLLVRELFTDLYTVLSSAPIIVDQKTRLDNSRGKVYQFCFQGKL